MTVLCGGGTSSARPGFGLAVQVGTAQIAATLNNVPTPLAVAAAGFIGAINYELSNYCNSDPPPMPTMTALDWASLLSPFPLPDHFTAITKFQDLLANIYWPVFCQCNTVSTPAAPALPAPPANLPTYQPPQIPSAQINSTCWDVKEHIGPIAAGSVVNLSSQFLPATQQVAVTAPFTGAPTVAFKMPTGVNNIFETTIFDETSAGGSFTLTLYMFDSTGHVVESIGPFDGPPVAGRVVTNSQLQPTTAVSWYLIADNGDSIAHNFSFEISWYCNNGSPNTLTTPCCPPDPSLAAALENIQALLTEIFQGLPTPLTSYADSTVHSGLIGNGTITLGASALAVRVNITTDAANLGSEVGSPTFLFDRGYIVPVVNSAPVRGIVKLNYNPQMYILPSLTEQIGYSLHPGVVASITELVRGP